MIVGRAHEPFPAHEQLVVEILGEEVVEALGAVADSAGGAALRGAFGDDLVRGWVSKAQRWHGDLGLALAAAIHEHLYASAQCSAALDKQCVAGRDRDALESCGRAVDGLWTAVGGRGDFLRAHLEPARHPSFRALLGKHSLDAVEHPAHHLHLSARNGAHGTARTAWRGQRLREEAAVEGPRATPPGRLARARQRSPCASL